ncbi:lipopolysaccharide biosynthesis protein [Natrialbaceae archaeon GCM10025810]|uniref:lipopolysaccharide biosynthesis protein n=1 Tax=Halovalidus salilacus TaxID=3075124 RepID=UPI0036113F29
MRIGQTSFVVFASRLVGSGIGFVATLYFARTLGAEVLGYYSIVLAVVAWLKLSGELGVSSAVGKRISEGEEPSVYFEAGAIVIGVLGVGLSLAVLALEPVVEGYVGAQVAPFVAVLLLTGLGSALVPSALVGVYSPLEVSSNRSRLPTTRSSSGRSSHSARRSTSSRCSPSRGGSD